MRTIKEVEKLTGITSQNIRYYEKKKLLSPQRNNENAYREYSEEDIKRLKLIRLFRSLDMPIGDIRRLFDGEVTLEDTIQLQMRRLQTERERLDAALEFCGLIKEDQLADMNVDAYLHEMEEKHWDTAIVIFQKMLDVSVCSSSILRLLLTCRMKQGDVGGGEQNHLDIVITKESLSPRLLINGIEYRAYRTSSRYGIVIHCEMLHPEDYIPEGMSAKKYRRYRILSVIALPVLLFIICNLWVMRDVFLQYGWGGLAFGLGLSIVLFGADRGFVYYSYGKNFRG